MLQTPSGRTRKHHSSRDICPHEHRKSSFEHRNETVTRNAARMRKEAPDRLTQANAGGPALQDGKADDHRGTAVSTPSEQRDSIERGGGKRSQT